MDIDIKLEQSALKQFCTATRSLFTEKVDEAAVDLTRVITLYPDTFIAQKSRFLLTMIILTNLYVESILTEAFAQGIQKLGLDNILSVFKQNRVYYLKNHEYHIKKRTEAFANFKKVLKATLMADSELYKINMYIGFCPKSIQSTNPMRDVAFIKQGIPQDEAKLKQISTNLVNYILLTMITDIFNIEFKDELSTLKKRKLDRVEFYDSCNTWLKKFYDLEPHTSTGELLRKGCAIVIGLTTDSATPARQRAYETFSSMSKSYYSDFIEKKELFEKDIQDIEDLTNVMTTDESCDIGRLINMATFDERMNYDHIVIPSKNELPLPIEINLEDTEELIKAQNDIFIEETETPKENDEEQFNLKIEFE